MTGLRRGLVTIALGLGMVVAATAAESPVAVREVTTADGVVEGVLTNRSTRLVRDVRLLVRHTWLWAREHSPGETSPGRATYVTVPEAIPPGGEIRFRHRAEPLAERPDGHFKTTVEVVGYTEVGE